MVLCIKSLLLKSDFIGFTPQLRIFEETRYKSVFSSIINSDNYIFFCFCFLFIFRLFKPESKYSLL